MTSDQATRESERAHAAAKRCARGLRSDLLDQIRRATELVARLDGMIDADESIVDDLTAHFSLAPTLAADIAALGGNLTDVDHYHAMAAVLEAEENRASERADAMHQSWLCAP